MTAAEVGALLSRRIALVLWVALGALWASGLAWMALHHLLARPDEFGVARHPLEAPVRLAHGLLALAALYVFGWFTARHAVAARSGQRRATGWLLFSAMVAVVLGGCLQLFATSEALQSALGLVHQMLGAALILPVLAHGWRRATPRGGPAHGHAHADP